MSFISFRRYLLDRQFSQYVSSFRGKILDVGGVKGKRRGQFQIPNELKPNWLVLNNDLKTSPDILSHLPIIPLEENSIDTLIITEVIEYIKDDQSLWKELARVLRPEGKIYLSSPFLHTLHGDYQNDFYRFTGQYFYTVTKDVGLKVEKIDRMGGLLCVTADLFLYHLLRNRKIFFKVLAKLIRLCGPLIVFLDSILFKDNFYINTGYWVVVKKQ